METIAIPKPLQRNFIPNDFVVKDWDGLMPFYKNLTERNLDTVEQLEQWLLDRSELDAVVGEDYRWRYIRMTIDSNNEKSQNAFTEFIQEISPKMSPWFDKLNRKLLEAPSLEQLDQEKYKIYLRGIKNAIELYREENIPLFTKLTSMSKEFGKLTSKMTVEVNGEEFTLQQANVFLEQKDRALREEVYCKIWNRRMEDKEALDDLFSELIQLRHQIALNAGFDNYRDYKFRALNRFDYKIEDCFDFHQSIATEILPILKEWDNQRKKNMGVNPMRPWDSRVDELGRTPLRPYKNETELIDKTIICADKIHPMFGNFISIMREMKHLDLDSRKGKHPGGYNITLPETGVPFIFMNSAASVKDMRTMLHESGHAIHSFLTRDLELTSFKSFPSEVSELASMTFELLSVDHLSAFFEDETDIQRAKMEQLDRSIRMLPWVATIDKFQHWIYTNPNHTKEERKEAWREIFGQFDNPEWSYEGIEDFYDYRWQAQLHLFEVPFYYIEYGLAQLGALALWKQYCENKEAGIENYKAFMKLGNTKTIGEIYEAANIEFNFSRDYVRNIADFVREKMKEFS